MNDTALILVGHGAAGIRDPNYELLREETARMYEKTYLVMMHGGPSARDVIPVLKSEGIRNAYIFPLFMSAGFHFEKDIASEDSFLRRAFSDAGIRTQLIGGGILEVPEVRKAVADHCLGRIRKDTGPRDAEK